MSLDTTALPGAAIRPARDDGDAILSAVAPLLAGIAETFGATCELVLHDYRTPQNSVVAVAGQVTGRQVGGAMSAIGLNMLARSDSAVNEVGYPTRTPDGRVLKCSTLPLRDATGALIGALCINVDITALRNAEQVLRGLIGTDGTTHLATTTFSNNFQDVVESIIAEEERERGTSIAALSRADRMEVVRRMHERGLFEIRAAAPRLAARLGVSRAALYSDLAAVRAGAAS